MAIPVIQWRVNRPGATAGSPLSDEFHYRLFAPPRLIAGGFLKRLAHCDNPLPARRTGELVVIRLVPQVPKRRPGCITVRSRGCPQNLVGGTALIQESCARFAFREQGSLDGGNCQRETLDRQGRLSFDAMHLIPQAGSQRI